MNIKTLAYTLEQNKLSTLKIESEQVANDLLISDVAKK